MTCRFIVDLNNTEFNNLYLLLLNLLTYVEHKKICLAIKIYLKYYSRYGSYRATYVNLITQSYNVMF